MGDPLQIDVDRSTSDIVVVALRGALDIASEPGFGQRIEALRREGHDRLRLDLSDLSYIDSRGLGALLRTWRDWQSRDLVLELVGPRQPQVTHAFAISGADDEIRFVRV